ncbi:MAG: hypothetical protein AMXMBFR13_38900 [Phycisphaerae bacterium]
MDFYSHLDERKFAELLAHLGGGTALGRIFRLVQAAGCRAVVVEPNPTETEYRKEHEVFYSQVMAVDPHAKPIRLHFFEDGPASLAEIAEHDKRYLGWCDIRPAPMGTVSNAFIDTRVFVRTNSDYLFVTCQKQFEVSWPDGRVFAVRAFPYVQQDGAVVRCAQAALTGIAQFYGSELRGPDFTDIGKAYPSGMRAIPSRGLIPPQIGLGIEKIGLEPVIHDYTLVPDEHKEILHCEQVIYRYIESGIPVLIGVDAGREMHALVVIGHTFTPDSWLAHTARLYYERPKSGFSYHCSTTWIERFVVQDDNLGPYMLTPSDFIQYVACKLVVVPLPRSTFLAAEEAELFAADLFRPAGQDICSVLGAFIKKSEDDQKPLHPDTKFWYEQFQSQVYGLELVLRTSLRDAVGWKRSMESCESVAAFRSVLDKLPLPENVWVVEISWPEIFTHARNFCGEVVLDPTALLSPSVPTLDQAWLWVHVPGVVMWRNGRTNEKGISILEVRDTIRAHHRNTGSAENAVSECGGCKRAPGPESIGDANPETEVADGS